MQIDPLAVTHVGQYPVRRFIAQGGMAWVFEVLDPRFEGQEVVRALKMLKPEAAQGEEFLRFRQEAGLLAGINHPNLVTIFDFGRDEATGCFFYVMTFVDGPSMADYIREYGKLDLHAAVGPLFLELLNALAELHDRGIVHRDIKPANVLIGSDNRAYLSDLGIARSESSELETKTNIALGTVKFMAPEQARGKRVSPASDVFAVGLTLYHALTGEYIYDQIEGIDSTSHLDVLGYLNSLERTGESIQFAFNPRLEIPSEIQEVVKKALRYKEDERYPDARAMHDALRDALYGDQSGPHPIPAPRPGGTHWPALIAAGVVFAAAVGFGVYQFIYKPMEQRQGVIALKDSIRPLRLDVPATLQRVRDIEDAISLEVVGEVETAIGSAQTAWQYAQEDIETEGWSSALANLRRAGASYETACEVLGQADIRVQAEKAVSGLNDRMTELNEIYAELEATVTPSEAVQRTWGELRTKVAGLSAPAKNEPCAPIIQALDQIDGVAGSEEIIRGLEGDLQQVGPTIAQKAREAATEARSRAEADSVRDRTYGDEIARGNSLLKDGDRALSADPFRARDIFDDAATAFESASAVVPAIKARANLRKIEQEIPRGGIDLGTAPQIISEAAGHFANGQWAEAALAYEKATNMIASRLGSERIQKEADGRRSDAREYRDLALKDGADRISPTSFEQAERAFESAETARKAGDFESAAKRFGEASQAYRDARSTAAGALQIARDSKADLKARLEGLLQGRSCSEFESTTARGDCDAAIVASARGDVALEEMRIEDANRSYASATRALLQSLEEENRYQSTKPQPPELTSRFPRSDNVEVLRGTPQRLEVTASDPNKDDELSYRWRFDGELVGEVTGKTFEFTPKRAGKVSVTIADRSGFELETSWDVSIKNLPPELTVVPKGSINLSRGQTQRFTATAKDPDGTPVSTEFLLNGKQVATGKEYTFNKTAPGNYRLEVVTRDVDGGAARATRKIRVTNRSPELTVTPTRKTELDAGQNQRFEARARDPEGTDVKISFKLDGKLVGRGDAYTFAKSEAGTYALEISAKDIDGSTTTARREIVVRPGNIFPETSIAWKNEVYKTLRAYEAALESKDLSKLERVWRFKPSDPLRDIWASRFRKYDEVSVRLDVSDARQRGSDQALVDFEQIESLDGRGRTWLINATMLKRAAGWQIIDYKREMKRTR